MQGASKRLPRAFRAHGSDDTLISDFWDTASKHAAHPLYLDLGLASPQGENQRSHTCYVSATTHRAVRWVWSRATQIGVVRYSSGRTLAQCGVA